MAKQAKEAKAPKDDSITIYEVSFIFLPTIAEADVVSKVENLRQTISKAGGTIISHEDPVLIDLAYRMTKVTPNSRHKADSGYFGWVKFEISRDNVEAIKKIQKSLDDNEEILRSLIIKTVRENTLINGKMKLQKEEKTKKTYSTEEIDESVDLGEELPKEASSEDMDKSIDELVIN